MFLLLPGRWQRHRGHNWDDGKIQSTRESLLPLLGATARKVSMQEGATAENHWRMELIRLEKTSKLIKSRCLPITIMLSLNHVLDATSKYFLNSITHNLSSCSQDMLNASGKSVSDSVSSSAQTVCFSECWDPFHGLLKPSSKALSNSYITSYEKQYSDG